MHTPSAFVSHANVEIHPYKCNDELLLCRGALRNVGIR